MLFSPKLKKIKKFKETVVNNPVFQRGKLLQKNSTTNLFSLEIPKAKSLSNCSYYWSNSSRTCAKLDKFLLKTGITIPIKKDISELPIERAIGICKQAKTIVAIKGVRKRYPEY